jgi:hypothetical protein
VHYSYVLLVCRKFWFLKPTPPVCGALLGFVRRYKTITNLTISIKPGAAMGVAAPSLLPPLPPLPPPPPPPPPPPQLLYIIAAAASATVVTVVATAILAKCCRSRSRSRSQGLLGGESQPEQEE